MLRVNLSKNELIKPLSRVQTIVDKKTIMNIINNVFLYTDESNLYIEATDLEISYRSKVPCKVIEQGAITISARKFYEIIKEFPSEQVHLEEDKNNWLIIGAGERAEYRMGGLPADDFPRFKQINTSNALEIDARILKDLIDKTIFSASLDDKKYSLSGLFFEKINKKGIDSDDEEIILRMVSSDGHRLSLVDRFIPEGTLEMESGIIIPRKGAYEIRKLAETSDSCRIGIDENFCFLVSKNDFLVIRLIEGAFPDYRSIIPETKERFFYFRRDDLFNTLKRTSILCVDSTFRGVKATITRNIMEIESLEKNFGEAREIVDIEYDGPNFEMAFNAKYMMDALSVMDSDRIEFTVNDPDSPCLLRGEQDPGFLALIMPMTLEKE